MMPRALTAQPLLFDLLREPEPERTPALDEALASPEFAERFWSRVERGASEGACWTWTGAITGAGYGRVWVSRACPHAYAHRVAYLLAGHEIAEGLVLDHLCRVRQCVNPAHLQPVTERENVVRGEGPTAEHARRTYCPRGHLYGGSNLRLRPDGRRACRACERERHRREKRERRGRG